MPALYLTPERWMLGYFCHDCDDAIDEGQAVILIDIDYSDRAGRAVAKLRHALCPCDADLYATGGDAETREDR
jgi:hypothetical protein